MLLFPILIAGVVLLAMLVASIRHGRKKAGEIYNSKLRHDHPVFAALAAAREPSEEEKAHWRRIYPFTKDNKRFYIDLDSEDEPSRLWFPNDVVQQGRKGFFVQFPCLGMKIAGTSEGDYVLRPSPEHMVYCWRYSHGTKFRILEPEKHEVFKFHGYSRTGKDSGILVSVGMNEPLKIKSWRSDPSGTFRETYVLTPNGEIRESDAPPTE